MALTDGIVGCWSPSIAGSGYLLPDLSGRANHGTLTNMDAGTDWPGAAVQGVSGRVLDFDGSNDYVAFTQARNIRSLCGGSAATIAFWVHPRSTTRGAYIADWDSGGGNQSVRIEMSAFGGTAGRIGGNVLSGSGTPIETSASPALNQWHHIAIAQTGSGHRLFWNGVLDATDQQGTNAVASTIRPAIGRGGEFALLYANAMIGELGLFNRALSSAEVLDIYRSGNGAIGRQLTGQTRRRVYGFVPATGARRRRILTGMV